MNEFTLLQKQIYTLTNSLIFLSSQLSATLPTSGIGNFTEGIIQQNISTETDYILDKCITTEDNNVLCNRYCGDLLEINNIQSLDITNIINKKVEHGKFTNVSIFKVNDYYIPIRGSTIFEHNGLTINIPTETIPIISAMYNRETFDSELRLLGLKTPTDILRDGLSTLITNTNTYLGLFHNEYNEYPTRLVLGNDANNFNSGLVFLRPKNATNIQDWSISENGNNYGSLYEMFASRMSYNSLKLLLERSHKDLQKYTNILLNASKEK